MYQLKAEVYLDKYNECYKKVIVLSPPPKDKVLKDITKKNCETIMKKYHLPASFI